MGPYHVQGPGVVYAYGVTRIVPKTQYCYTDSIYSQKDISVVLLSYKWLVTRPRNWAVENT